jgi:endonuclease/exonuclease/phosphatase family metal-dependent hydrolase
VKIITLNTWGGRAGEDILKEFFARKKSEIDIFCLQEIWSGPYDHLGEYTAGGVAMVHTKVMTHGMQEISSLLNEHTYFFRPHHLDNYGLLMLVKDTISVVKEDEIFVHKFKGFVPGGDVGLHARNVQYVETVHNSKPLFILNFHGLWNGKGKTDSEDRLIQSRRIVEFIATLKGEVVFCGDFNLLPDTQSIKILEDAGLRNLVTKYDVSSTRTPLYTKQEKFADYIFVSKGVRVKDFKVLPDIVSDHAPLYIEIE